MKKEYKIPTSTALEISKLDRLKELARLENVSLGAKIREIILKYLDSQASEKINPKLSKNAIFASLPQPFTTSAAKQVFLESGLSERSIERALARALKAGVIKKIAKGVYTKL